MNSWEKPADWWKLSSDDTETRLDLDPPNNRLVKAFLENGEKCFCGSPVHFWEYVEEEDGIVYSCSNEECPFEACSSENFPYPGLFYIDFEDSSGSENEDDLGPKDFFA